MQFYRGRAGHLKIIYYVCRKLMNMNYEVGYNWLGLLIFLGIAGIATGIIYMIFMLIAKARVLWYLGTWLKNKSTDQKWHEE
jgi:hypothetical protein